MALSLFFFFDRSPMTSASFVGQKKKNPESAYRAIDGVALRRRDRRVVIHKVALLRADDLSSLVCRTREEQDRFQSRVSRRQER